jgi:hypothetical protein
MCHQPNAHLLAEVGAANQSVMGQPQYTTTAQTDQVRAGRIDALLAEMGREITRAATVAASVEAGLAAIHTAKRDATTSISSRGRAYYLSRAETVGIDLQDLLMPSARVPNARRVSLDTGSLRLLLDRHRAISKARVAVLEAKVAVELAWMAGDGWERAMRAESDAERALYLAEHWGDA